MSDFSRRSFLRSVCLGGVALSLPKQMGIVAATMKDLKDPPIMAAYAKVACPESFRIYSISVIGLNNNPATLYAFISRPKAKFEKICTIGTLGTVNTVFEHPALWSLHLQTESFFEFWAVALDGTPILRSIQVLIAGYHTDRPHGNHFAMMGATLDHVRLERVRAIKLGLINPSEPQTMETEVTGKLIVRN